MKRAGWELDEATWKRPMAARVVRFLLIQGTSAVPEDALFEAFWADRTADAARQHLAVAVSRARKVLDLPGAESSVIEARERTYRLRLRERDSVDSLEFENAAASALAAAGRDRRTALERAAALWTGEPLPEDRYAPWSFAWRERLTETYCQVLGALIDGYERVGRAPRGDPRGAGAARRRPAQRARAPPADGGLRPQRPHELRAAPVPRVPPHARGRARRRAVGRDLPPAGADPGRRAGLTAPHVPLIAELLYPAAADLDIPAVVAKLQETLPSTGSPAKRMSSSKSRAR